MSGGVSWPARCPLQSGLLKLRPSLTQTRRLLASLLVLAAASGCGGDGLVLPDEARPAAIAIVSGNDQSAAAGATLGQALVVRVTDALNRAVEGQTVAFTIDAGGGQVAPASAKTNVDGQATATWTLGPAAGQQRVQAKVEGASIPATLLVKFSASAVSGTGALLELVSGDNQTAAVGSALSDSLVVRVTDALGNPSAGVQVDWTVAGGGSIGPATVLTGGDGLAAAERVLGLASGIQSAQASVTTLAPVVFTHTATAANPTALVMVSGDGQIGAVGVPLADSLVVRLSDDNGNGVGGQPITWVVATGGGSVSPVTATTNPNGFAKTRWTLGGSAGSNLLNAVSSGLPSVPFTATAQAGTAAKLAFSQVPVTTNAGATITPAVRVAIQDAGGNTVASATGAVTMAIGTNPGGGNLSGTTTVNAVNGVATFSTLAIDKAGTGYTLDASAAGLASTTSPAFDILTGGANRLVFVVEPTDRVVGQTFSPAIQVQVQDAGGNPVLTAGNSITLTSSVTGTLSGTAVVNASGGTATFSNLAITRAGNAYTLTALASGVASRTSAPFDVAQAATTIGITNRSPGASVPGQNVTVTYRIDITSPGSGNIGGQVTVSDGTTNCLGGVNAGSGIGSCALAFPTAGTHQLVASYTGDQNLLASESPAVAHLVNKANTTINIQSDAPDPSVVGQAVTVRWNLTSPGSAPLTGTVSVTGGSLDGESCSAEAALGTGSCQVTFGATGSHPITATYSGDANYNGSSDGESHTVNSVPNVAPTAVDDPSYTVLEDGTLTVNAANGVLLNDSDPDSGPQSLTARNASTPSGGSVTLNADGSFVYTPNPNFNGTDTFTYQAFDGAASATATVTVTVTPVNDVPSFVSGGDVSASASGGAVSQAWATSLSAGPANESGQTLTFTAEVPALDQALFSAQPAVASDGTLTFTPSGIPGQTTVTVRLRDNGGTANGGIDTSPDQTFTLTIDP